MPPQQKSGFKYQSRSMQTDIGMCGNMISDNIYRFTSREAAAHELAEQLEEYRGTDSVVLAIPRGGVSIGYIVAGDLDLPLDIVLSKKIGHPNNPEYAIGSVTMQGILLDTSDVSDEYISKETHRIWELLDTRYRMYMGNRKPVSLTGRHVIIVDDGIATGNTVLSTIAVVHKRQPASIIVATPVAAPDSLEVISEQADEIVCLLAPRDFFAVGQFYKEFHQLTDDEVIKMLNESNNQPTE